MSDQLRRQVLDAIARGELPSGGPSELAARDLLDDAPAAYWERWAADTAARIRARLPEPAATEEEPPPPVAPSKSTPRPINRP
jgi:anti-sigma factor RsiW